MIVIAIVRWELFWNSEYSFAVTGPICADTVGQLANARAESSSRGSRSGRIGGWEGSIEMRLNSIGEES